jgi:hypothetical protein
MFLISHRGNTKGLSPSLENDPCHLKEVLQAGFDIEIDVWSEKDKFYLGHDYPQYSVNIEFLKNEKLWCHAKNLQALEVMLGEGVHCFWHQEDNYTLTSKGYIWTYPNKPICKNSIIVCKNLKETQYYANLDIAGICSDYVGALI